MRDKKVSMEVRRSVISDAITHSIADCAVCGLRGTVMTHDVDGEGNAEVACSACGYVYQDA